MKRVILSILTISLIGCTTTVQEKQEITITTNDAEGRKLMIAPMGGGAGATEMVANGSVYSAMIPTSPTGFYELVSIKDQSQSIIPFYVPVTEAKGESTLAFGERGAVDMDGSEDNRTLGAYATAYNEYARAIWQSELDVKNPAILKAFMVKADSVINAHDCSDEVKEFLKIWNYIHIHNTYDIVARILKGKQEEMPYKREDLLPEPHTVMDSPLASLFTEARLIVYASLPNRNNLDSALIYLEEHYSDTTLKAKVKDHIAGRYVTRFNYADGFEKGLERLQKATEKYGLDPSHAERFAKLKATIPGQPFPEGVELKDANGNVVDFATFRGKYVYIDLWASWCSPCLKEVPALQKLEKELKNDKVVFLSISIDTKEDAWKNKMKEKNMHGNQLWDPTNSLGQALNVKGIPFFAIYDPEGRLYMHGAPRPSQGPGLVMLLEGLK
ncbi:MAG: TlpA family protein disulfide reductase [Bacteroidaceae bacterium]|nr:TlpA family protein disulfide reductase [Bacteroidaceae bacterium]